MVPIKISWFFNYKNVFKYFNVMFPFNHSLIDDKTLMKFIQLSGSSQT